jgi:hypothetical protein
VKRRSSPQAREHLSHRVRRDEQQHLFKDEQLAVAERAPPFRHTRY